MKNTFKVSIPFSSGNSFLLCFSAAFFAILGCVNPLLIGELISTAITAAILTIAGCVNPLLIGELISTRR